MIVFSRLLTGLLALALTSFGVVATAPAHAHQDGPGHGVRELVFAHAHVDLEQAGAGHQHDDHHTPNGADDPSKSDSTGPGQDEHAHVHACPQFTPCDPSETLLAQDFGRDEPWPVISVNALRHSSFPPLRPPRAIL